MHAQQVEHREIDWTQMVNLLRLSLDPAEQRVELQLPAGEVVSDSLKPQLGRLPIVDALAAEDLLLVVERPLRPGPARIRRVQWARPTACCCLGLTVAGLFGRRVKREAASACSLSCVLVKSCMSAVASRHARLASGHGISTAADLRLEVIDGVLVVLHPLDDEVHAVGGRVGTATLDQELLVQGLELLGQYP